MKAFLCVCLVAAAALAAPEGKRDKRGFLSPGWLDSGYGYGDSFAPGYGAYSLGEPLVSHSVLAKPAIVHESAIINEPAIVSVKKIVEVPKVVSLRKVVSVPRVVAVPHVTSHLPSLSSLAYEPSISAGWW